MRHSGRPSSCVSIVEAFTREKMSGLEQGVAETGAYIVVRWNCKTIPETFFWRGQAGWFPCRVERVHARAQTANSPGDGYQHENVAGMAFAKGDTLMLTPLSGGKFPVPAEVKDDMHNLLFYKTAGSGWQKVPVNKFKKKPPVFMP